MTDPPRSPREQQEGAPLRGLGGRLLLLSILVGMLAGVGGFTLDYAEGLSYLSEDPEACTNCHVMKPRFESWQKSSHHAVATCAACHLPHDFLGKYLAKGWNGLRHSAAFTLQNFPEPIQITELNGRILQASCVECHREFVHDIVEGATTDPDAVRCVHCHRSVGHGDTVGLGGPERSSEKGAKQP
jgi:cytochrome c nitrite reductase small subunit